MLFSKISLFISRLVDVINLTQDYSVLHNTMYYINWIQSLCTFYTYQFVCVVINDYKAVCKWLEECKYWYMIIAIAHLCIFGATAPACHSRAVARRATISRMFADLRNLKKEYHDSLSILMNLNAALDQMKPVQDARSDFFSVMNSHALTFSRENIEASSSVIINGK